jgi:hypothetical protein
MNRILGCAFSFVSLLSLGSSPAAHAVPPSSPQSQASISCEVTRPNGRGTVRQKEPWDYLYGNDDLAIDLPGVQMEFRPPTASLPPRAGLAPVQEEPAIVFRPGGPGWMLKDGSLVWPKTSWWRGERGELKIEGRRIDAPAPRLRVELCNECYNLYWVPVTLIFPTPGCWEITGRLGRESLTFITRVVRIDGPPRPAPDGGD